MIHVVFSDVVGSMVEDAQHFGQPQPSMKDALNEVISPDMHDDFKEIIELAKAYDDIQENEYRNAEPLKHQGKVISFQLDLQFGDISEQVLGEKRAASIALYWKHNRPEYINEKLSVQEVEQAKLHLNELKQVLAQGEDVYIWYGYNPMEYCGLAWLLYELKDSFLDNVYVVECPRHFTMVENERVYASSWIYEDVTRFAEYEQTASQIKLEKINRLAEMWKYLKKQNAPFRTVVDTEIVGLPSDAYDEEVKIAINRLGEMEFSEDQLIHEVLRKDANLDANLVMHVIDRLIDQGYIEEVLSITKSNIRRLKRIQLYS